MGRRGPQRPQDHCRERVNEREVCGRR
jgi:hypothetical protein